MKLGLSAYLMFIVAVGAGCSGGSSASPAPENAASKPLRATTEAMAELFPVGRHETRGVVRFRATEKGVLMRGRVQGLSNGNFGISIHEKGDCSAPDAKSVGAPFAPAGQLEDINADVSGNAEFQREIEKLKLDGPDGIAGKALVIHAWPFDPKVDIKTVPFVACGVIRAE